MVTENEYVLRVQRDEPPKALDLHIGPLDIGQALLFVDAYLADSSEGWRHTFVPVVSPADAPAVIGADPEAAVARARTQPPPALLAQLRHAIIVDPRRNGLRDPAVRRLLAHLDPHRPLPVYDGDEDCLLGRCTHPRTEDGLCAELLPDGQICRACTPTYPVGAGHDGLPLTECHDGLPLTDCLVPWPCGVVTTLADFFGCPVDDPALAILSADPDCRD